MVQAKQESVSPGKGKARALPRSHDEDDDDEKRSGDQLGWSIQDRMLWDKMGMSSAVDQHNLDGPVKAIKVSPCSVKQRRRLTLYTVRIG